jgi:hypothetical protein
MNLRQEISAVLCLTTLLLSGCAPPGPLPPKLVSNDTDADAAKTEQAKARHQGEVAGKKAPLGARLEYETAVKDCDAQATKQTMGSLLTIVTRLRPGAYRAAYVACMKSKGYEETRQSR